MSFSEQGFVIVDDLLPKSKIDAIIREIDEAQEGEKVGGIRNAEKQFQTISNLIHREPKDLASEYLGKTASFVRAILFNKTLKNNWLVTWHQDRTVQVSQKVVAEGWGPWSIKAGYHHVQPPLKVLNSMVTLRIHLDAADQDNGCLKILPSSHKLGLLSTAQIKQYTETNKPMVCNMSKGSTLVMRPHLLHSSSKGQKPSNRRILHLEYSSFELPMGVKWV